MSVSLDIERMKLDGAFPLEAADIGGCRPAVRLEDKITGKSNVNFGESAGFCQFSWKFPCYFNHLIGSIEFWSKLTVTFTSNWFQMREIGEIKGTFYS
ncbi:hypothetical protein U9M73_21575 [Paenibacillus phoenicis]|uniref:Uncharacterized protein n=1 Tax=Paenibacillus phoenicis TaxID=554117 RepID=A0ABU5PRF2_9BACL|nr:hypothetical protein [Paenibacillus phoenicis]MEA3572521.1 hypothetical protein [Paenibacillus phoenicis]